MAKERLMCKGGGSGGLRCLAHAHTIESAQGRRLIQAGYTDEEIKNLLPLCSKHISKLVQAKRKYWLEYMNS